jgi:hypothetical protein
MQHPDSYRDCWSKMSATPKKHITNAENYTPPIRASLWIVTYNNREDLQNNLQSLFDNYDPSQFELTVNIINNHTNFHLAQKWENKVKVWHNILRPDTSVGHLGRNWNEAIMAGFGSLANPNVDIVITAQDDVIWLPQWANILLRAHTKYSFITQGHGDAVVSYLPQSVRRIGLWDERYSPSFYAEGDYFLRALMYNREESSINDPGHGRQWNIMEEKIIHVPEPNVNRNEAKNHTLTKAAFPWAVWWLKWNVSPTNWDQTFFENLPTSTLTPSIVMYPHFEMDVEDLVGKNYAILF